MTYLINKQTLNRRSGSYLDDKYSQDAFFDLINYIRNKDTAYTRRNPPLMLHDPSLPDFFQPYMTESWFVKQPTIEGTQQDDYIVGLMPSFIYTVIMTRGGNDYVEGTILTDYVFGGEGNDTIYGFNGADQLWGGAGNDMIYGGDGDDFISGGTGNDYLYGDDGDDFLFGTEGYDHLYGGDGNDTLVGGTENDRLFGGDGDDLLYGGADNDYLVGGRGNDTYLFKDNDGHDTIYNKRAHYDEDDTIHFEGLTLNDLHFVNVNDHDLMIYYGKNGQLTNSIQIVKYFDESELYEVQNISFSNGDGVVTYLLSNVVDIATNPDTPAILYPPIYKNPNALYTPEQTLQNMINSIASFNNGGAMNEGIPTDTGSSLNFAGHFGGGGTFDINANQSADNTVMLLAATC